MPPPLPPDDPDAWYARRVRAQYAVAPDMVVTAREFETGFRYLVREPALSPDDRRARTQVREHFASVQQRRPLTREGTKERAAAGFPPK